jgi:hypothetical protein
MKDDVILIDGRVYISTGSSSVSAALHNAYGAGHEGVAKTLHRL